MEISRISSLPKTTSTSVNGSQHRDNMQEISTIMNDVPAMTDEAKDTALVERSTADDKKKDIISKLKNKMTLKLYAEILDILSDDANRPYLDHDLLSSCLNYASINHSKDIMYKCIELDSNSVYHADFKFSLYNKLFAILSAIKTKKLVVEKYSYQEYFLLVCGLLDQAKEHLGFYNNDISSPLRTACHLNLTEVIKKIHELRPDLLIDIKSKDLMNSFNYVCSIGHLDIVKCMIELHPESAAAQHAEVDDGMTGLMVSIIENQIMVSEYLLDYTIQHCPDTLEKMDKEGKDAEYHLMIPSKKALYAKMLKFRYTLGLSLKTIEARIEKTKNVLFKKFGYDEILRAYIYDKSNEPFLRFFLPDILCYSLVEASRLDITRYCLEKKPSLVYWIFTDDYLTGNPQKYTAVQFARKNKNQAAVKLIENTKDRLIEEAKRRMPKISSINEDKPVEKLSKSQKRKAKRKKAVERVTTTSSSSTQLICTDPEAEKKMMEKLPITIVEKLKNAILNGDDEVILSILKDPNSQLDQESIAQCLMYAMGNNTDIIKQCIALDSSCVQFRDFQGLSLYLRALVNLKYTKDTDGIGSEQYKNYLQSIKLLLVLKDQLDVHDSSNNTPLSAACSFGLIDVVREIYAVRSDLLTNVTNIALIDSFINACRLNQLEVVKYMVELQPNIILAQDQSVYEGCTGLMMAIHENKSDIYNYLIDYSIENNLRALMLVNNEGRNVREIAISKRNQAIVKKIDQALAPEKIKTKIINEVPRWIAEALELEREQQKQYEEQRRLQRKEVEQSRQRSLDSDYSESESSEPKYSEAYLWYLANNGSNIVVNVKKSKRKKHTIEVVQETQRMVEKEQMSPEKAKRSDSVSTLIIPKECEDVYSILTGSFKDGALYFVDALHFIDRLLRANASLGLRWERNFKRGGSHNTIRILDANGNQTCRPFTLVANDKHLCSKAVKAMAESINQLGKLCQDSDSSSATSTQSSSSDI